MALVQNSTRLINAGYAPTFPDDSRYILRGRTGSAHADVRIWPGLTLERKWRVTAADDGQDKLINIECCVLETDCGPLFRCTAFLDDNEGLGVEGTSMTSAVQQLVQRLPGSREDTRVNSGPLFFGLRTSTIAK